MFKQLIYCFIFFSFFSLDTWAQTAEGPPPLPFPRIEVGAHIDRPVDLAIDSNTRQIVSVSDDRTIRFWDQDTGRLIRTKRVPMNERKEGELYALAIAPQARLLVIGGWTGYSWDKSMSIYVFNIDTMQMIDRITGIHERITAMDFSQDEQRLAVALIDGTTLMYSSPNASADFNQVASSELCRANSYRIHFGSNNKLVVQCFDNKFYVYDYDLGNIAAIELWKDHQVGSVHWSPDSSKLLLSFFDQQRIVIVDGENFELIEELDTSGLPDTVMPQATWSADGRYVLAAGDLELAGKKQLVRWDMQGSKIPEMFPLSNERIFRLLALADGSVTYSSLEHAIGKINSNGDIAFYKAPPIVSHYERDQFLYVSADASAISFALDNAGTRFQHFSIPDRSISVSSKPQPGFLKPLHQAKGMRIENWHFSKNPSYNGKPFSLYPHQESNAFAISPTREFFALALDSELRLYHKNGQLIWSQFTQAGAASVNISQDGKTIVAGLQDGSIRWYRASDGEEFFALFAHKNEIDWVAWTPPGFFIASPDGDKYIGWQLNNSATETAEFYSAWQFERLLYRPDIVQDYFDSKGIWNNSRQFEKFRTQKMRTLAPPKLALSLLEVTDQGTARIRIESNKRQLPIEQYTVFVNDLPVTPFNERLLSDTEQSAFIREHEVPLNATENNIRVETLTQSSFQVANLFVESKAVNPLKKGDLYLLAIGVNELSLMPQNNLNYAAQDAVAIADLLNSSKNQFQNTHIKVLSDLQGEQPTKNNILSALSFLQQSGTHDTVILYIAAHGISNKAGDYFMVPSDGKLEDLVGVMQNDKRDAPSLIRWDSFFEGMRNSTGRRMLIVDTCEAQKIKGNFDFGSLAKRSAAVSFGLLSASTGDEQSQEYPPAEQGLFTFGLLKALEGQADNNQDSIINLEEIYTYTKNFVEENRLLRELPQTPQLLASASLRSTALNSFIQEPEPIIIPEKPIETSATKPWWKNNVFFILLFISGAMILIVLRGRRSTPSNSK